jgi:hypothetical protein
VAGSLSDFAEAKVLDLIFKGATWTQLASGPWVALFTTAPTDSAAGTEVTGGSYARVAKARGSTHFQRSGNQVTNKTLVTFPTATAPWGTVVAVGVLDAASGGNLIAWAPLPQPRTIGTGSAFTLPANTGFTHAED